MTATAWTSRSPLNVGRGGLISATVGGMTYAIGGFADSFKELDVVEVLGTASDDWQLVAPLATARGNSGAAAARGEVYALGGFAGRRPLKVVEIFDPAAGQWRTGQPLPGERGERGGPGSAAIGDRIYVIGGFDGDDSTNAVNVFDPSLDTWRPVRPMPTRRRLLKVAELSGRLYAIGGVDNNGQFLRTVEVYESDADTWRPVAPMTTTRGNPGVVAVGGRIFVVGGSSGEGPQQSLRSSEVYDPDADRWEQLEALFPVMRSSLSAAHHLASATHPEAIIAFGGFEGVIGNAVPSRRVEALAL